jgi:hypothetical protein
MTETAVPKISMTPRAPTGAWKLSCIDGHSRPRAELGRATVR